MSDFFFIKKSKGSYNVVPLWTLQRILWILIFDCWRMCPDSSHFTYIFSILISSNSTKLVLQKKISPGVGWLVAGAGFWSVAALWPVGALWSGAGGGGDEMTADWRWSGVEAGLEPEVSAWYQKHDVQQQTGLLTFSNLWIFLPSGPSNKIFHNL